MDEPHRNDGFNIVGRSISQPRTPGGPATDAAMVEVPLLIQVTLAERLLGRSSEVRRSSTGGGRLKPGTS